MVVTHIEKKGSLKKSGISLQQRYNRETLGNLKKILQLFFFRNF